MKLDAQAEAHKILAHQYDKLQLKGGLVVIF